MTDGGHAETLCELLEAAAFRDGRAAVMTVRGGAAETMSASELRDRARRLASTLAQAGLARGEPVVLFGPNSPEWIIGYFAIVYAGGLAVPLDVQASARELARAVADCGARRAVAARSHAGILPALAVVAWDAGGFEGEASARPVPTESTSLPPRPRPEDPASLLYTSGTTGTPKAVPLTHRNLLANVEALAAAKLTGPGDRALLPLPLHHGYPFTVGLLGCLATGTTLVLPEGHSGPQLVDALRSARATILIGVPRLFAALLDGIEARVRARGSFARYAFRRMLGLSTALRQATGLRIGRVVFRRLHEALGPELRLLASGGAALDESIEWRLEGMGWEVLSGYGLTETGPIVSFNPRGRARHGSAGLPLPAVDVRIHAAGTAGPGEILVRGPNVFAGYRDNPEATQAAFTGDGWFRTGDLGYLDRGGYLHVVGRAKDVIVLAGGNNVMPEDVEDAYAASPLIREIAVFERGGALAALVVPDEEAARRRGTVRIEWLIRDAIEETSARLPTFQRIGEYRLTRARLPRTPLGKVRRFLLAELYARAEQGTAAAAPAEPSEADRRLLASEIGGRVWSWLGDRFAGQALSLDASPQLDLHVDSLEWVALTLEIQDRFGIVLTEDAVARVLTVRDLLNEIVSAAARAGPRAAGAAPPEAPRLAPPGIALRALAWLLLALNGLGMRLIFRLRAAGAERLPAAGPLVVAPSHASYLDPLAVAAALPYKTLGRTCWIGWTGFMFATPLRRLVSRATRVLPIDPDRDPAGALALAAAALAEGQVLVWFPEGRRSPTGELGPFLPGIGELIRRSGARALPVLIEGTYEILPRHRRWPRPGRIAVTFGAPQTASELEALGGGEHAGERIADGLRRSMLALRQGASAGRPDAADSGQTPA